MVLMVGGVGFAYKAYKDNRPSPIWVPLPINPELPDEKRVEIVKKLKAHLTQAEVLMQVSKDLKLPTAMNAPNHESAAHEIGKRVFVEIGEANTPTGSRVPSINVGVKGKAKDRELSGKIAVRLVEDVQKLLGTKTAATR
jgi:hypothetical protein